MPLRTAIAIDGGFRFMDDGSTVSKPNPGPPGWTLLHTYNLTTDEGWTITPGNRNLDSSYNRPQQVGWSGAGMTITAQRAAVGATIYSADAQALFYSIPGNYFAIEADITLGGYVGKGCFPAFWLRPNGGGQGEIDIFELMANQDDGNSHYKSTAILTQSGTPYNVGNKAIQIDTTDGQILSVKNPPTNALNGKTPAGFHTYRLEKTFNKFTYYVDGVLTGTITQAQVDAQASTSSKWANQFESGENWYARLTYQFGSPTDGRSFNAGGDPPDSWVTPVVSTMVISRMQVWAPNS